MKVYKLCYVLYSICMLYVHSAVSEDTVEWRTLSNSRFQNAPEFEIVDNKGRDKRALGLILSGLAQVFGYTVNPVQVASLPNPNSAPQASGNSNQSSGNPAQPSSSTSLRQSPTSPSVSSPPTLSTASTTVAPRQRETIRFTGVVNFGNNSDILSHLQQYERIFHGESTTQAPTITSAPSTSSAAPLLDPRTALNGKPPLLSPLLVKIPIPIVPNIPTPLLTTQDMKLSHPETSVPRRKEQETVYQKKENKEEIVVENKDIYDGKNVKLPMTKYTHHLYLDEPGWKKQHEDRLAELERKQKEHAEQLRQQASERNREKDYKNNYQDEKVETKYKNEQKPTIIRKPENNAESKEEENTRYSDTYSNEEDNSSAEKYENDKRIHSSGDKEDAKTYRDESYNYYIPYKEHGDTENTPPSTFSNYTSIAYKQQLPISDYYENPGLEGLRNSYGEVLNTHGVVDEGIVDYYERYKQPQSAFYEPAQNHNFEDVSVQEEKEEGEGKNEFRDNDKRLSVGYQLPARANKYEEYDILDRKDAQRDDKRNSKMSDEIDRFAEIPRNSYRQPSSVHGDTFNLNKPINYASNVRSNSENEPNTEDENGSEERDFLGYTPYILPVRYLDTFNNERNNDSGEKITSKGVRKSKEDELRPKIGLPTRLLPKKLHEGETKELQLWPAPFDYVFDSSKQTNVRPVNGENYANSKHSNTYQKPDSPDKENRENRLPQERKYITPVGNPTERFHANPENVHRLFDEPNMSQPSLAKHLQRAVNHPVNSRLNYIRPPSNTANINQEFHQREKELPDYLIRRYTHDFETPRENKHKPSDKIKNYTFVVEDRAHFNKISPPLGSLVHHTSQQIPERRYLPIKSASANQDIKKLGAIRGNYYSSTSPHESNRKLEETANIQNTRQRSSLKPSSETSYVDIKNAHDLFGLSKDDYNFDGEETSAKSLSNSEHKEITDDEIEGLIPPEPVPYRYDESLTEFTSEPESETEKVKIKEFANKVASVRISEHKQLNPNRPISYTNFPHKL